jgi:hypothetical protein
MSNERDNPPEWKRNLEVGDCISMPFSIAKYERAVPALVTSVTGAIPDMVISVVCFEPIETGGYWAGRPIMSTKCSFLVPSWTAAHIRLVAKINGENPL